MSVRENFINLSDFSAHRNFLILKDNTSEYTINKDEIIYASLTYNVLPFNLYRVLGIVLLTLGGFYGAIGIIAFYMKPLEEHISIFIAGLISVVIGFLLLIVKIKPPIRGLPIYKAFGLVLLMLGFWPFMMYPSRFLFSLIFSVGGISIFMMQLRYCCELELRSGRILFIIGKKEAMEKLYNAIKKMLFQSLE